MNAKPFTKRSTRLKRACHTRLSLFTRKSQSKRRYYAKVEEVNNYQTQLRDLEVQHSLKIEKMQNEGQNDLVMEVEKKYSYQIEHLYTQMSEMEKKHKREVATHMEQLQEV
jgi:hypothetical protein